MLYQVLGLNLGYARIVYDYELKQRSILISRLAALTRKRG